jgi:hypothetical protein
MQPTARIVLVVALVCALASPARGQLADPLAGLKSVVAALQQLQTTLVGLGPQPAPPKTSQPRIPARKLLLRPNAGVWTSLWVV